MTYIPINHKNIIFDNSFLIKLFKYGHKFEQSNGPQFISQNDQSNGPYFVSKKDHLSHNGHVEFDLSKMTK
jgi:hypothetical protein